MKLIILSLTIIFSTVLFSQEDWTDKSRALPDELRKVPVAIFVRHGPNPNYPEKTTKEDKSKYDYVWRHSTYVISPYEDLEVIKAGSYIWYDESGWKRNIQYDKKAFKKFFECPKAILEKGQEYVFEKNYRFGNQLYGGDALWYVIAKDKDGNIYKGMALLETESELLKNIQNQ